MIGVIYNFEQDGVVCPECRALVSGLYIINAGSEGIFLCFECMRKLNEHLLAHINLVEFEKKNTVGVIA